MGLVERSRTVNDGQVDVAVRMLETELGSLRDVSVLVLGLTYREGVHELAYSRAIPLIERLAAAGAHVSGWDPLLTPEEIAGCGVEPWTWGSTSVARAVVLQTADKAFRSIDPAWWPDLEVLLDGRNGMLDVEVPEHVRVLGIGVPPRGGAQAPRKR
jgi:UDP-N-acetyl-D-mannosaminuronic acid dehydrogenase